MKIIEVVAKVLNQDGTERESFTTEDVILEALCAYRDQLIQSDDWQTIEVQSKLWILQEQIVEVLKDIPVK